jgi:hypothetical protein
MTAQGRPYVLCLRADIQVPESVDNEIGICVRCNCQVQHRPDVPTPNYLLCLDCFADIQLDGGGVFEITITAETLRDIYLRRHRN